VAAKYNGRNLQSKELDNISAVFGSGVEQRTTSEREPRIKN